MPLETASTIAELNENNPVGASDTPASLDNHIQLIKAVLKADALVKADIGVNVASKSHTHAGYAASGAVTSSGITQSTSKLLGRTTSGTGEVEEISVGSGLSLGAGVLTSTELAPGTVIWFAASTAPTGYLKANGAAVSRTTYASLFTAIGTTFGAGDGSTTFNIPDLRGEFVRGFDDARGVDSGRVFGSAQTDAFEAHTHAQNTYNNSPHVSFNTGSATSGYYPTVTPRSGDELSTDSTGGSETRPRNIALLACIKY